MTPILRVTLLYSIVPVLFTVIGAGAGVFWPALSRLRTYVLYLAAGVVFSVVAVDLLPEIQRRALVADVVIGFVLGIGTMLAVDKLLDRIRGAGAEDAEDPTDVLPSPADAIAPTTKRPVAHAAVPLSLIVAVAVDFLLDGLLLGVGFAAGARIGILLALAEAAEQLAVGLALSGELLHAGVTRTRVLLTVSALGTLVFLSAVLGGTVLRNLTGGAMEIVLSFGAAALLYLVTEELLREAHEEHETPIATAMFFVGFLAFLVIGMTLD